MTAISSGSAGQADVDEQVDHHVGQRKHQDDALDHRVVAAQNCIDREPSEAWYREHGFGYDHATDQQGEAEADGRDNRDGCILERMYEKDFGIAQPL
jgi:hypothetical protein